jgi:hypothetical protein
MVPRAYVKFKESYSHTHTHTHTHTLERNGDHPTVPLWKAADVSLIPAELKACSSQGAGDCGSQRISLEIGPAG